MNKLATIFVSLVLTLSLLPAVLSADVGSGIGITMETEKFAPLVWMCDSRIVLDDNVEPGQISDGGEELIERIENYAFEGEQIQWRVLVMDKNGIEKIKDVYMTIGSSQGSGNEIEANCQLDEVCSGTVEEACNARILEEHITICNPEMMAYYTCTFTVETPVSMHGQYWVTVEAEDLDGLFGDMDENEFWFLNPEIALSIEGGIDFGTVRPGALSYSDTLLVGNAAEESSGVLLDMYVAGTDFYDPSSSGAKCPDTNQLALTNFAYFATNGAYSTQDTGCDDAEGYVGIEYGNRIDQAYEIIGCEQFENVPVAAGLEEYTPGNVLSPGAEIAMTFRLDLPEPCNGDFSEGSIWFWGEAV
ncbi:MAG: hypothetical protein V1837_06480 [Candidatus Woesearchaeota archaeon]